MQDSTKSKRIVFIIIYIILFILAGYFLYKLVTPAATCTDGIKNQNEQGVDCGGQCAPCKKNIETKTLNVEEISFVDGGGGTYDVVAKIANPNFLLGSQGFDYAVTLRDAAGNVVVKQKGHSFILPAETKYLTEIGLRAENNVAVQKAEIEFADISWQELKGMTKPQLDINNDKFQKALAGAGSEVSGSVKNNSLYDLNVMYIVVVLRDQYGKVLGVNATKKDNVLARSERSFLVSWPNSFKGNVAKTEIEAQANVYDLVNPGN